MAAPDLVEASNRPGASTPHRRHVLLVAGGFALLFTWLFARPLLENAYLAESDLYEYFLPQFLSPITIWSTFEFAGMPAFADPGEASVYPLQLLGRLLGSWTALVVAVYLVGACGMYAYVYSLTRSRTAAAFSAVAYSLSEAMMERLAHFGLLNTIAWFPLILLSIDRLRGPRPARWIAIGALVIGTCLLAGNPQVFLYAGYICGLYALAGGIAERAPYRYYFSTVAMVGLGALLTAVKTLPVLEASQQTARQMVRFEAFAGHANTPAQMLSILFPTIAHEGREAPTYVGLLTLVFALTSLRQAHRNWRVAFWLVVVVVALLIGAGDATPVARWVFDLPMYDKFRVGARHLVFAALGLATLGGLGVAAVQRRALSGTVVAAAAVALVLSLMAAATALAQGPAAGVVNQGAGLPWPLSWWPRDVWTQLLIGAVAAVTAVGFARTPNARVCSGALVLLLACDLLYAQPYAVMLGGLDLPLIPADAVRPSVHAERLADGARPMHQRVLSPDGTHIDAVVPAMFARVWKIPIAGGYGPMLLSHYSMLAMMGTNGSVEPVLMAEHNAALDLLAVKYVVMHGEDFAVGETTERHGVTWTSAPIALPVGPQECGDQHPRTARYALPAEVSIAAIALDAHLRCAEGARQGDEVATIRVIDGSGMAYERALHAGIEIAEEGLTDPGLRQRARHQPATIFDPDAPRYTYFTRIDLPAPMRGARMEVTLGETAGALEIDRLTAIDDQGRSIPQTAAAAMLEDGGRWLPPIRLSTSRATDRGRDEDIPGEQPYLVFENRRARPLAWLVQEVVPLGEREVDSALHYSLLPDGRRFDPASMATVESGTLAAAHYPSGAATVAVRSVADSAIRVGVSSDGGGFLVLSESYYPGWRARVDGTAVPLYRTDLALQGVVVPPGQHTVDFEFVSTTLRAGLAGSLCALGVIGIVLWRTRRPVRSVRL